MMDPRLQAEMDQRRSQIVDLCPPLWRGVYLRCIEEGFTEEEAFKLLHTFILATVKS